MNPKITVLLLISIFGTTLSQAQGSTGTASYQSTCNYVTLVKCFIDILDDWAWTLYELKDNVVTITQEQCAHLQLLDKCVNDDIDKDRLADVAEENRKHQCKHSEVIEVSNTVSDLLTHRKQSGSFLKSYYLLTYACSPEGQAILSEHRECLKEEKIGEMTLSAGTYLSDKFLEHEDEEVCEQVNKKLDEYMISTRKLCKQEAAAKLMCKSLINMFKGLHSDKLDACDLVCNVPPSEDEPTESNALPESEAEPAVASEAEAMNPANSAGIASILLAPAVMLLIR